MALLNARGWARAVPFLLVSLPLVLSASVMASEGGDRVRLRFDDNWKFLRGPEEDALGGRGPFVWEWKYASVSDLNGETLPDEVNADGWQATQLGINTLNGNKNRFGWYKTEMGTDPKGASKVLEFESVDDNAVVYLNGKRLYKHIGFGIGFKVPVKSAWNPAGPNTLVVLIENTAAGGGINGGITFTLPSEIMTPKTVKREFDDAKWRTVHLPHDYVVEGTFTPNGDVSHGSLPKPTGTYRKTFTPSLAFKGKSVWVEFDGIYRNSSIYLNGKKLGDHSSGYIGVRFDISKLLEYGKPNTLAVTVDPRRNEGWWYEGGGIYRHVWLNVTNPVHVDHDGIFARTVKIEKANADVRVTSMIKNESKASGKFLVTSWVMDPSGKSVNKVSFPLEIGAGKTLGIDTVIPVLNPKLWDLGTPNLYTLVTTVSAGKRVIDATTTRFGIREIKWDKDKGFLLNGRVVKLQGTCNHQDHAGVGIAMPDGLQEWRIKKLLEMGSNAYRTSHNPTSPEFMDLCDKLGMLVLDETRHLGDTTLSKTPSGTKADDLSELKTLILRDRNHPSVIGWSLYNEEGLQGTTEGAAIFKKMQAVVDKLDGTRISTGANNFGYRAGIQLVSDVYGYNYNIYEYDNGRRLYPNQVLYGSETSSAVSTRGEYANDTVKGYVSAYDVNYPDWGMSAEGAWKPIGDRPWMAGAFVWTGFDYKGEPTPYGWPCINSHFGIIDIAGFPKDNFYYYQAVWGTKPMVHVFPHWNWAGSEGKPVNVWVHSNAESVELILNGKSLGSKNVPHLGHLEWSVPYSAGILEAVGSRGGKVIARDRVETTGEAVAIRLKTDRRVLLADHEDLTTVAVEVVDAAGRVVPGADHRVNFSVTGAGVNGGVGNGDPSDHEPDKAKSRKAFHGLCMVLVQSNGKPGKIRVTASVDGMKPVSLDLVAK